MPGLIQTKQKRWEKREKCVSFEQTGFLGVSLLVSLRAMNTHDVLSHHAL